MNFNISDISEQQSPLQRISSPELDKAGIELHILRDDLNHPLLGDGSQQLNGNKWRKLKFNIEEVKKTDSHGFLTFGGAFSNHLHAVAAAGKIFDIKTIGVVRGEPTLPMNATMQFCVESGMKLIYWRRSDYKMKDLAEKTELLHRQHQNFKLLPEGGTNRLALKGITELWSMYPLDVFDQICIPVGTGGSMAGLITGSHGNSNILGFAALKFDMRKNIEKLLKEAQCDYENWELINDFNFGGFVKYRPALIRFINQFKEDTGIPLDPLYTGKMLFGIFEMIKTGKFKRGTNILAIHTGGAQGIVGFNERFGNRVVSVQ